MMSKYINKNVNKFAIMLTNYSCMECQQVLVGG